MLAEAGSLKTLENMEAFETVMQDPNKTSCISYEATLWISPTKTSQKYSAKNGEK